MLGTRLDITLDDSEIGTALARVKQRAGDLPGLLDDIGGSVASAARHRFETGLAPDGEPWEPSAQGWTSTTSEERGRTLVGSGHLRDSITHQVSGDEVAIGTNVVYGAIHQFGGKIEPKADGHMVFKIGDAFVSVSEIVLPARPYLGLSADDREEVLAQAEDWLAEAIGGGAAA